MNAATKIPPARVKAATRANLGFLIAKASQRWNEQLAARFSELGYPEVRPSYGSVLLPLFEEDNLRIGEIAARARLSKQTMTTLVRLAERDGLVARAADATDRRATRISLTRRASEFSAVAEMVVAGLETRVEQALGAKRSADLRAALSTLMEL
jgi:MarR family transcriptional regulator, temperature-dependent positive regulator of motility